jgi:hypothetical protein
MKRRQKYYFLDYTDKVNITRKILMILLKQNSNEILNIDSDDIIKSLRWNNIKRHSIDATIQYIDVAFKNLQQLRIDEILHKTPNIKEDSCKYTFKISSPDADFDFLIQNSGFAPIEGRKQVLTDEMKEKYKSGLTIDYNAILKNVDIQCDYKEQIKMILPVFIRLWKQAYCKTGNSNPYIIGFPFETYETLFDQIEEYPDDIADTLSESYIKELTQFPFDSNGIVHPKALSEKEKETKWDEVHCSIKDYPFAAFPFEIRQAILNVHTHKPEKFKFMLTSTVKGGFLNKMPETIEDREAILNCKSYDEIEK